MKRYLGILVAALVCSASAWAVMASPEPFEYTKPDGTKVMARIYGDEFHSYIESLDGELLEGRRDAEALEQAAITRSLRRATKGAGDLTFPRTGSPRSLVLLVGFSDLDFEQNLADFQDLLMKSGYNYNGATGSCRDYYIASSDSIFQPQFDCYGPYKLTRPMAYYGAHSGNANDANAHDMVAEACQMAHAAGVNFKNYDANNDGILDNVFVFYAGHNEAEGGGQNTIWPHQSNIAYLSVRLDGILINSYACTSEYKSASGKTRCGVGTFCHEFGHVIGQPDFYDTKYNYYSVGNWSIMCQGSYNNGGNTPPTFSAYERMYEGWLTPKQLELPGQYTLSDVPFKKEAYLIAASTHNLSGSAPNPNEFFILDYRSGDNGWDAALPNHGMIVWHIDYSASAWSTNTPNNGPTIMRMHLEEANGINWKKRANHEDGRASDVYPGSNNVTSFNPTLHNGTSLEQPIFNITEAGSVINFTYISTGGTTLRADEKSIELTTTYSDNKKIVDWEPQHFNVLGTGLAPDKPLALTIPSANFRIYAGDEAPAMNSSLWVRSLSLNAAADSTLQQRVWVSFVPTKQSCSAVQANLSISSENASITLPLTGYAPRPTYVKVPETLPTGLVTPYSFVARWVNQEDAEKFYVTLYQVEEGTTEFKQNFENFSDPSKILAEGWKSNTNLTTTTDKSDGQRALYLKNYGDVITSETYPSPVTKLSFWYSAFASLADTIGVLQIEAYNDTAWVQYENVLVAKNSKKVTAKYDIDAKRNFRAFRITWIDNGENGVAFDAFVATTSQKINYVYKGTELSLTPYYYGDTLNYTISGLMPASTYYYQVQATDLDKGCEEHLTVLSDPIKVTTIAGQPMDSKQLSIAYDSINYNPAQHTIYLTTAQNGDYLYFYNTSGGLVYSQRVQEGVYAYPLDLSRFLRGEVYMVQHAVNGKLGRKNKWAKFVY